MLNDNYKAKKRLTNATKFLVCVLICIVIISPMLITLFSSFKISIDMVMT